MEDLPKLEEYVSEEEEGAVSGEKEEIDEEEIDYTQLQNFLYKDDVPIMLNRDDSNYEKENPGVDPDIWGYDRIIDAAGEEEELGSDEEEKRSLPL